MGQRPPSASAITWAPICLQRIEDAPHRALAKRGVAVEGRLDRVAADDAHHQPRAGARVAEIEDRPGLEKRAEARPMDAPAAGSTADDLGAELAAGLAGAQHVLALQQAVDLDAAARQQPEKEGAVRDRFVARRPHAAGQRAAPAAGERELGGVCHARPLARRAAGVDASVDTPRLYD